MDLGDGHGAALRDQLQLAAATAREILDDDTDLYALATDDLLDERSPARRAQS